MTSDPASLRGLALDQIADAAWRQMTQLEKFPELAELLFGRPDIAVPDHFTGVGSAGSDLHSTSGWRGVKFYTVPCHTTVGIGHGDARCMLEARMKKLSLADKGFLLSERRETPMNVGGVNVYTLPDGQTCVPRLLIIVSLKGVLAQMRSRSSGTSEATAEGAIRFPFTTWISSRSVSVPTHGGRPQSIS